MSNQIKGRLGDKATEDRLRRLRASATEPMDMTAVRERVASAMQKRDVMLDPTDSEAERPEETRQPTGGAELGDGLRKHLSEVFEHGLKKWTRVFREWCKRIFTKVTNEQ